MDAGDRARALILLSKLAAALVDRYHRRGVESDLDWAILLNTEALARRDPGHKDRIDSLNDLAVTLNKRYYRMGSLSDLGRAIELYSEAMALMAPDHGYRGAFLNNFASALIDRFDRTERQSDLEWAIELLAEALMINPPGHINRDVILNSFGNALRTRYDAASRPSLQALASNVRAAAFPNSPPPGQGDRRASLYSLANASDLERAIELHTESLALRPPGHGRRGASLVSLAKDFSARYDSMGLKCDLDRAMALNTEALLLCPPGHENRSAILSDLAISLNRQYDTTKSPKDLERATELLIEALAICPLGHRNRVGSLSNLARTLRKQYDRTSSLCHLEKAIQYHTEALSLCPPGYGNRSVYLSDLGNALRARYDRMDTLGDLKRAIDSHTEALTLCPPSHENHSLLLNNLATAHTMYHKRTGSKSDLDRAMELCSEALAICPPGHISRSTPLTILANALNYRYDKIGIPADLERVIELHGEALELYPAGHSDRSLSLNNLAIALVTRYSLETQSDADMERAIELHTEALSLCPGPSGDGNRISSLTNLANALSIRYEGKGDQSDLERAIALHAEALVLCPPGHGRRGATLINVANPLCRRYERIGLLSDLEQAVELFTEAVALFPPDHGDRSLALNNLAIALSCRFDRTGDQSNLERAIELFNEALTLLPPGYSSRAKVLKNLGVSLSSRYRKTGTEGDLKRSIELYSEALSLCGPCHEDRSGSLRHLAIALIARNNVTVKGEQDDLKEVVGLLREALKLQRPGNGHRSHTIYLLSAVLWCTGMSSKADVLRLLEDGSKDRTSQLDASLECARLRVRYGREVGDQEGVKDAYSSVINLLQKQLPIYPTVKLQYDALCRRVGVLQFPMDAAAHAIETGNVEHAVELLDTGRSLLWSELQRFREPLRKSKLLDKKLAEEFEATCLDLQYIATVEARFDTALGGSMIERAAGVSGVSYDVLQRRKRERMERYEILLGRIKQTKGLEGFLERPSFEELKVAAIEGPVIIVNCSEFGSHAIVVFADRPPSLIQLDQSFRETALRLNDRLRRGADFLNPVEALGRVLKDIAKFLWDDVVESVVKMLEDEKVPKGSRIWWCPTSFLTRFPFHAAGNKQNSLIDFYVSSYTPTLKALIDARKPSPYSPVNDSEPDPRILVVAQTQDSSELKSAKKEVDVMFRLGSLVDCLDREAATNRAVLEGLQSHSWAHFICHGMLSASPFDSSLVLYEEKLSFHDIIKARLPDAKFAFLAACHTAEQSPSGLDDEVLHIASAIYFSGFRSVVGTLWKMRDEDGPEVARIFYEEMFRKDDAAAQSPRHTRAAHALWKVAKEMKDGKRVGMDRWANFVHIGA